MCKGWQASFDSIEVTQAHARTRRDHAGQRHQQQRRQREQPPPWCCLSCHHGHVGCVPVCWWGVGVWSVEMSMCVWRSVDQSANASNSIETQPAHGSTSEPASRWSVSVIRSSSVARSVLPDHAANKSVLNAFQPNQDFDEILSDSSILGNAAPRNPPAWGSRKARKGKGRGEEEGGVHRGGPSTRRSPAPPALSLRHSLAVDFDLGSPGWRTEGALASQNFRGL